jgi:prepilin-type N-terminal cleavage/methylation domain-containing protein
MKQSSGFTLIEVLTVSVIMVIFAMTIVSLFLATVRGGTKAQVIQVIRQNGDSAMKAMTQTIRNSQRVACNGTEILVYDEKDNSIRYFLDETEKRVASDSSYLTGTGIEAADLIFLCQMGELGNQVVTINFKLSLGTSAGAQVQEKLTENFKTSVSLRQY